MLFILFLTSMQVRLAHGGRMLATTKRAARLFAGFSFTHYAIHIPLIGFAGFLFPDLARNRLIPNSLAHLLAYAGTFAVIVTTAYLFHLPFEANTGRLRTILKSVALRARSPA